jgi:TetR/AcrR family transcriptional regulator, repressor for uid operon
MNGLDTMPVRDKLSVHAIRRMQTRERLLGAATAEFKRSGMDNADVGAIVAAAGVVRGTFYFHFPTKEHVLLEVERREEARIATELGRLLSTPHDLRSVLAQTVELVAGLEKRLGPRLYRDLLSLNFSQTRPPADDWSEHPMIVLVMKEIELARDREEVDPDVDAFHTALVFLLGLYALLTATHGWEIRASMLDKFVAGTIRGIGG